MPFTFSLFPCVENLNLLGQKAGTKTGREIGRIVGQNLGNYTAELGGKVFVVYILVQRDLRESSIQAPILIFKDACVKAAVNGS